MFAMKLTDLFETKDIGSRHSGKLLREKIEGHLFGKTPVTVDFGDINLITQSFADEFVGVLVRRDGVSILSNLKFKNCNDSIKDVIRLVVSYSEEKVCPYN